MPVWFVEEKGNHIYKTKNNKLKITATPESIQSGALALAIADLQQHTL
ncbi:DUF1659 domain-containing protein [Schinkia sp. CFF1]